MSTKYLRATVDEMIEWYSDYVEECERSGRRDEASSVRRRLERATKAKSELEAIEKAAKVLSDDLGLCSATERAEAKELMESIAREAK